MASLFKATKPHRKEVPFFYLIIIIYYAIDCAAKIKKHVLLIFPIQNNNQTGFYEKK